MNFKLFAATALLFTASSVVPALAADQEELAIFQETGECIDCNLSKMSENEASLKNMDVEGANLAQSSFVNSDLRNANLRDTNLKGVNFNGSDLRNADLSYANVSGANFCDADLRRINWQDVIYDRSTRCLPDEAIAELPERSSNRRSLSDNVNSVQKNAESVKKNAESVKETADTVKDILSIF